MAVFGVKFIIVWCTAVRVMVVCAWFRVHVMVACAWFGAVLTKCRGFGRNAVSVEREGRVFVVLFLFLSFHVSIVF